MHFHNEFYQKLSYLEVEQIEQIRRAYLFASSAHAGQKRDTGEDYIIHPVAVACILADLHIDYQSIVAALLHDVIEDTPTSKEKIIDQFGQVVADLVDGITKINKIESSNIVENYAQNFRKMILAMSRDIRVILIKLADRLHNMRTIGTKTPHKRNKISRETLDIYAPIANRLGMHNICVELENLAFAAIYPRRYRILEKAIEEARGSHKEVMTIIEEELNHIFAKSLLDNSIILGRKKHLYGIYKKMVGRHSFTNIMDVYAFRIIVKTVEDCYRALGIVHSLYKPMPGKFKDYIAIPKFNGYQSLHTVLFGPHGVPIEIQIRTKEMNQLADDGIAAHWSYKTGDKITSATHVRAKRWMNSLLELQQNTSNALEFIENVKVNLFPDEIYVFTPKGDIMELPRGATVVDFAYAVHTDVGNACVAARVNRLFVSLSSVLLNGQVVSIITSSSAKPNPAWLNFVITSKARSNIRSYLKSQKRGEIITLGRQLLAKELFDLKIDLQEINPEVVNNFLKKANFKLLDDLYGDVGLGNHLPLFVAHQLANAVEKQAEFLKQSDGRPLLIHGAEGMAITFAGCCCPIPGDEVVGFFKKGHGLDVHVRDCVNATKLNKQPEKFLPVCWAEDVSGNFQVKLKAEIFHKRGALAALTKAISKAHASIDDIGISERSKDYLLVSLSLLVKSTTHLARVMRRISKTSSVAGVTRLSNRKT